MAFWIIIFIIICVLSGPSSDTRSTNRCEDRYERPGRSKPRKMSRKERKRIEKAKRRAEMDAWEDMIMYMEAWY